ncbi:hypothetical protein ILUMI_22040 [Ignelater luminosus]|uniref:PHD-type domain-containing protein n=1 Tax=Ignelater luminosus TaxID=2038154 RepID=A0A8K0CEL9_IGNLU|nr:hypothetical protein ILUMI_22040 [Ignelater luminosus]
MNDDQVLCHFCSKSSLDTSNQWIFCDGCDFWFHISCVNLTDDKVSRLGASSTKWFCNKCQKFSLPSSQVKACVCPHCPQEDPRSFKTDKGLAIHIRRIHPKIENASSQSSKKPLLDRLSTYKKHTRILRRIPKGARHLAAQNWMTSFEFLKNKKKGLLTSLVKDNINSCSLPEPQKSKKISSDINKRVTAKVADFHIRGAVKLFSSNDTLADTDENTYFDLKNKHPSPSRLLNFPSPLSENHDCLTVCESDVQKTINSFPSGSASGIDGLLSQHLKDMISKSASDAGRSLLMSITQLCNLMLAGKVNALICPILYGASLCALKTKDGGLRPIAVGNVFRRLTAKLACHSVREDFGNYFRPHQVGFATQRGCEAAIHAVRTFANAPKNVGKVLLEIDYKNAFNSVERDVMIQEVSKKTPSLFPFLWQCYSFSADLLFGNQVIPSLVGVQQGDPAGPMIFSLAIQPIIDELKSELNVFYLDDGTLSDDPEVVLSDFMNLIDRSHELGLQVNPMKCELYFCSGAPVFEEAFLEFTTEKFKSLETMINRLIGLPSHVAYFLLKNCFAIPKLTYLLRTSPTWKFPEWCSDLDNQFKNEIARLKALQLPESGAWLQAIPSSHIGTLMNNNSFRVCVALRIGSSVCCPYNCICGAQVSVDGRDGLHCGKGSGRFLRHNELNDILKHDGKRPDGMTLVPWSRGQHLVWDATCTNIFADSHVAHSAVESGYAAEAAAKRKHSKYKVIKEMTNMTSRHVEVQREIMHVYAENSHKSYSVIAKDVKSNRWTVKRTIDNFKVNQTTQEKPRSGRPKGAKDKKTEKKVVRCI